MMMSVWYTQHNTVDILLRHWIRSLQFLQQNALHNTNQTETKRIRYRNWVILPAFISASTFCFEFFYLLAVFLSHWVTQYGFDWKQMTREMLVCSRHIICLQERQVEQHKKKCFSKCFLSHFRAWSWSSSRSLLLYNTEWNEVINLWGRRRTRTRTLRTHTQVLRDKSQTISVCLCIKWREYTVFPSE